MNPFYMSHPDCHQKKPAKKVMMGVESLVRGISNFQLKMHWWPVGL
jgi:hypothetical protein